MKGREGKGAPPTDLLVCFPSTAHLTLMPKRICSPARPIDKSKRHSHNNSHHHNHHQRQVSRSSNRGGQASPLLWAKSKPMGSDISEPTSPKVTCAGQIKVKSKPNSCKNWQSVMEEIERLHKNKKHKKKTSWVESFGFKKDAMQFLTCLRGIRFDLRCFGSFPGSVVSSDDEEEEEEEEEEVEEEDEYQYQEEEHKDNTQEGCNGSGSSRTVFSKWFMVLEENQDDEFVKQDKKDEELLDHPCVPPSNALLLMRCRSAPAKSWLEEKQEQQEEKQNEEEMKAKLVLEEEKKRKDNFILKFYAPDFKVSSDIAKETWVVGGTRDPFSRSRSWKR